MEDVQVGKEWGDQNWGGMGHCELPLDAGGLKQLLVNDSLCEMQFELALFEVRWEISPSGSEQFVFMNALYQYLCVIGKIQLQMLKAVFQQKYVQLLPSNVFLLKDFPISTTRLTVICFKCNKWLLVMKFPSFFLPVCEKLHSTWLLFCT